MNKNKIIIVCLFILAAALFLMFDLGQYFNLSYIKSKQQLIDQYYFENPIKTGLIFFVGYILITGISLPAAAILTLASGAIFGIVWGTILVSFGSVFGATMAFLLARYFFHDYVQKRFGKQLGPINRGIRKEGALYLFAVRLIPVFPFFVINILMALTPIKTLSFALVSQIAMLLPIIIFVNAGTQLAKIESPADVLSPGLIVSFVLLGLFPLIARRILVFIRGKQHKSLKIIETEHDG